MSKREIITSAVRKLGETSFNIQIQDGGSVAMVYVNHEYFGIYDFVKKTFVD